MTRIIGHRGAAGLALENTLESFRKAFEVGVDAVEFDVHTTKDGVFVVCHDPTLKRVSGSWAFIKNLTFAELQDIPLKNGETVPTLESVLQLVRDHNIKAVVEIKAVSDLEAFCRLLDRFSSTVKAVASFNHDSIDTVRKLRPQLTLYVAENLQAFRALRSARRFKADGIDLNFWLLSPFTYWLARRRKLDIMVYTVDWPFLKWFITKLYPAVEICTNMPHRFVKTAPLPKQPL